MRAFSLVIYSLFTAATFLYPAVSAATEEDKIKESAEETVVDSTQFQEKALKLYLDLDRSFQRQISHVKTEIPYVNYVRDRKDAQVYLMLTTQKTGSDGTEYTLTFIGQQQFVNKNDTLKYVSRQSDSEEVTREGVIGVIKMGLMRYVARTPFGRNIAIRYLMSIDPVDVVDKWKQWVFNVSTNFDLGGESSRDNYNIRGSFDADRVTPESKVSLHLDGSYRETNYSSESYSYKNITRSQTFRSLYVKSLGDHWSIGAFGSANSSTYSNTDISLTGAPAIEYDVFPYSMSTRREFRFLYRLNCQYIEYLAETIYFKTKEMLFEENLTATFEIKERWGSVQSTLEGSHYFHDFSKNQLRFSANLNLRLFKGLSIDLRGSYSIIHDQLSLEKGELSEEDILLRRKQQATSYRYSFDIGFRYQFGSIYSNVVNPRFGSGGGDRGDRMRWF